MTDQSQLERDRARALGRPAHVDVHRRSPASVIVACTAWVLTATWLQMIRGPGNRAWDVLWAEDGSVFLNEAMRQSLWHNLITPHAGYLQVIARLVAQPAAHLPLEWVAAWMAGCAALVVAGVSLIVWFASARLVGSGWARGLLTALVPLLPQAGFEVNATVSNLHWYLAYAAFWVLLAAPRSGWGRAGASAVVVLAALSDPLTALVLPAAALGVKLRPRRQGSLIVPAAMMVALTVQAWVHLARTAGFGSYSTSLWDVVQIYAVRVVMSAVTGDRMMQPLFVAFGLSLVAVVGVLVLVGLAVLMSTADPTARTIAVVAVGISVLYLCVPLALRGATAEVYLDRDAFGLGGSRYTVVPLLMLWTAVVVLLDRVALRMRGRTVHRVSASNLIGIVTACFLGVQLLSDWAGVTVRSGAPPWNAGVQQARAHCQGPPGTHGPQKPVLVGAHKNFYIVPIVAGPDDVTIPIPPQPPPGEPMLFGVVVDCSNLRE